MKSKKQLVIGLLVVIIGFAIFTYLKPVAINKSLGSIIYSFEEDFEKETFIILTGKLHKDPFGANLVLGEVIVDKDIKYQVKLKDNGTHYFYPIVDSNGTYLKTIGTIYASADLENIWMKLDEIDKRYGIDGYVFGPASNKEEANELIKEILTP